jgi:hypothetical protein
VDMPMMLKGQSAAAAVMLLVLLAKLGADV